MARKYFNDGQEVVEGDHNDLQALHEQELYDRVIFEMVQRTENALFNDSFKVGFVSGTLISVSEGSGFQTDNTVDPEEPTKRLLHRSVSGNLPISTPDGALDRIDIVTIKHNRITTLQELRKYKATIVSIPSTVNLDVEKDWEADVVIVAGTPNAVPVAPATPSGYIKIAELYVSAVTGIANAGAITDSRPLMPVGGALSLNTLGKLRITAGAAIPLTTIITDIDAFLVAGRQEWTDFVTQGADPAAPAAGRQRVYRKGTTFFQRDSGGAITPFGGSGGGGGGGANWVPFPGNAPTEDVENNEKVWLFESGLGQKLTLFCKVPESYVSGQQIKMFLGQYSPSSANTQLLQATAYLVRKNLDAISSVANSYASTNTALTNTVANQYRDNELDLTNAVGQINAFSVTAGDILKIELTRGTDTDTADVRLLPSATEVKFG